MLGQYIKVFVSLLLGIEQFRVFSPFLQWSLVYILQTQIFGFKHHNCVSYATIVLHLKMHFALSSRRGDEGGEILHFCSRDGAVNDPSVQVIVVLYHSYFAHVGCWRRSSFNEDLGRL